MTKKEFKKVILIDDESSILDMYKAILETRGYEVFTATDGKEGLEVIKKEKPDLILSDIVMPGEDGFYVLSKLNSNKELKDIPILMLTNLDSHEDKEQSKKLGANGYLVKVKYTPFNIIKKIDEEISVNGFQEDSFIE